MTNEPKHPPAMTDEAKALVEQLRKNSGWRNESWQCVTDPTLLIEAADLIETQAREIERLREAWKEPRAWLITDEETSWVTLFEPNPNDHPYCDVIPLYSAALGESHD